MESTGRVKEIFIMANRKALTPQQARSLVGMSGTGKAKVNSNDPIGDTILSFNHDMKNVANYALFGAPRLIKNWVDGPGNSKVSDATEARLKAKGITDANLLKPYSEIKNNGGNDPYANVHASTGGSAGGDKTSKLYNSLLNQRIKAYHPDVNQITNDVTKQYDAQYNPMINRQHEQANLAGQDVAGYFNQASDLSEHDLSGQRKFMSQQSHDLTKDLNRLSVLPGGGKDRALLNNAGLAANASRTVGSSADQLLGNMANAGRAAGAFLATNARSTENAKADDMERARQSAIDSAIQDRINNSYQRNSAMQSNNIDLAKAKAEIQQQQQETNPTGAKALSAAVDHINTYASNLQDGATLPSQTQAIINQYGITDPAQIQQIIAASKAAQRDVTARVKLAQQSTTPPQGG